MRRPKISFRLKPFPRKLLPALQYREKLFLAVIVGLVGVALTAAVVLAATSSFFISNSSTTLATSSMTQKRLVRTSDGTLHSFVQTGTQTTLCDSVAKSGLIWFYSTDAGASWTCGAQLSSDTTNLMYASATVDVSDNVYLIYSAGNGGASTAYGTFYRKLTKGEGAVWATGDARTVIAGSSSVGYSFAVIENDGTRTWVATRYFDGANYQVSVYYSNDLSDNPTWTISQASLNTPGNNNGLHYPSIVRFGTKIGVVYQSQFPQAYLRWRVRDDADGLTSWSPENIVTTTIGTSARFNAISDANGNVYLVLVSGASVVFNYWNGSVWSPNAIVSSAGLGSGAASLSTDGTNVWVFYQETTGLTSGLSGNSKLVYKRGWLPYTTNDFELTATKAVPYQDVFDKYWKYTASGDTYTDDTADLSNVTSADSSFPSAIGDMAYFGKLQPFDSISWSLSTAGVGGAVTWKYWNGSDWNSSIVFTTGTASGFTAAAGWGAFTAPSDWQPTIVNSEGTPYYYLRAEVTSAITTPPVGIQAAAIPNLNLNYFLSAPVANTIYGFWAENSASPVKVRSASVTVSAGTPNDAAASDIAPYTLAYASSNLATQPSTERHLVRTSDGTLHAFVNSGNVSACGSQTTNNGLGINWIYSTDSGQNWTCGGQIFLDNTTSNFQFFPSAAVDTADNIYVTYSVAVNGASGAYNVYYRKLTKGEGSTWTLEAAQTVLTSSGTEGYSFSVIEAENTDRLWLATRYFDGLNYVVKVYYSSNQSAAPTWTVSSSAFDLANNSGTHVPAIVRFNNRIGVIYSSQNSVNYNNVAGQIGLRWRFRQDGDALTSWSNDSIAEVTTNGSNSFTAVSDGTNVYVAYNPDNAAIYLNYWDGVTWQPSITVTAANTVAANNFIALSTDGAQVWVFYNAIAGLSTTLPGNRNIVYRRCVFAGAVCDAAVNVVGQYNIFDKYWSYVSSVHSDKTTAAGNTTAADATLFTGVGDMAYFGKLQKYDSISWSLSTNGIGGQLVWEYWNGSAWKELTKFIGVSNGTFLNNGYLSFIAPGDWQTTNVGNEATPYYYVRARVVTAYSTPPVGTQFVALSQTNFGSFLPMPISGNIYGLWTENSTAQAKVRFGSLEVSAVTSSTSNAEIDPPVVGYSTLANASWAPTMRKLVRTSDGTLHAFIQAHNRLACGNQTGNNNNGLMWIYSTDEGATWTCGAQLSNDLTNVMYASATVDGNDNIYVVYSVVTEGSNLANSTYYRKMTKQGGANWSLGNAQIALDASSGLIGYSYSVVEVEGTSRLWLATRYFDGSNYQVSVYYSNNLSTSPTWTLSQTSLDTPNGATTKHFPALVRFGTKVGVIYSVGYATTTQTRWRWRNDADELTAWSGEATVGTDQVTAAYYSAVGDSSGRVYYASNNSSVTYFSYWNGTAWSATTTVNTTASTVSGLVSLVTDGYNVWVIFGDSLGFTGFTGGQQGYHRLAYKKGIPPYTASEFDVVATPLISYHGIFDKYWSYVSGGYLDDTTDAGSIGGSDLQMVSAVNDIAYFGKLQKFDTVNWQTPTAGVGGVVVWEYWNGSAWAGISSIQSQSNGNFVSARGYVSFTPPTNWATTPVNDEGTPYYYVRARVVTAYSTPPVGTQADNMPRSYASSFLPNPVSGKLYGLWSENIGVAPMKVRFNSTDVTTTTANAATYAELKPNLTSSSWYSGGTVGVANATRYSTQRKMVKTSDGTLHAFIQASTSVPCAGSNGLNNTAGLIWIYSTDSGQNWTCGGQVSNDLTNLMYASATVDASDNIYLVYSTDTATINAFYGVFYRKLTKGAGSTWTLGAAQTVASGGTLDGYSFAVIEVEGDTRLWVAARYYDNNNYQVSVFNSSDLSDAPTWTLSQRTLDNAGNSSAYHYPALVRFGSNIGVIYNSQTGTNLRWRWREDSDGLTSWNPEAPVSPSAISTPTFSAVGDALGKVYVTLNTSTNVYFTFWNGLAWSANATVSSTAYSSGWVSVGIVGTTAYVYYGDTTNLSTALPGNRRFVYKKGLPPYATVNFDASATTVINWHGVLDKYWKYTAAADGSYADITGAAANTTAADTALPSAIGDIGYFGKLQKFDALSWGLSTVGIGGQLFWEYWNSSAWVGLNGFLGVSNPSLLVGSGYLTFLPPSDWATTIVNGEETPYYYLRARVVVPFTTPAVATQLSDIPPISWGTAIGSTSDLIYAWSEGGAMPNRVRFSSYFFNVAPSSPSVLGPNTLVTGGYTVDETPTLTYTVSDPNVGDTVQYRLQISTTADFAAPLVDYTSALASSGSLSFTIGQAAGTGTYATGAEGQTLADGSYYWRLMAIDQAGLESAFTTANGGAIAFYVDSTNPETNADDIIMLRAAGDIAVPLNGWTNSATPYFSWDAGADTGAGSGVSGYCLYLGVDSAGDPATSKGLLGTSPVSTAGTTCQFIVSTTLIDLSTSSYHGDSWLTNSTEPYYLNVKAIDAVGNIYAGSAVQFQFRHDSTLPTNVTYISPAAGNFSNVADMSFSWPVTGDSVSTDTISGLLGWQYQINSTSGTWKGSSASAALDLNYIPAPASTHQLTSDRDGSSIVAGNNTVYFRTIDQAGNVSDPTAIRTGVLQFGGSAPTFGPTDSITVTPSTSSTNSYEISWPAATSPDENTVTHYYYMVNTTPPATLATLQSNASTYLDNGTGLTLAAAALPNVNRGSNTVYVVAVDDDTPANYSPSNYISGDFILDSTSPDNVANVVASDSSIKSQSLWNVTLTWTAPSYQGAGNLTYLIHRSSDGTSFSQVGTSTGLSYVDSAPTSALYYYKIYTQDGASALSSGTNAVSITPTGRWTIAPTLDSDPAASSITTKKATITWTTNRAADSKIQYGTSAGSYGSVEPSNSTQVTGHSIGLTGLTAGTTYYYKAKWTDEDGNTTSSSEKSFTTAPAPTVKDVSAGNIGLSSTIISFTSTGASSVKIYYGTTTAFGLTKTIATSINEAAYSAELTGLTDGTKYYYKINTFDSDGSEYDNQVNDFTTLPRPKISGVRIQQVVNTAQTTILVTWSTNTEVSSIVTFYPEGSPSLSRDEVNVALIKGEHRMIVGGLLPQTSYLLVVKGRDKVGNEASSDSQKVDTSVDTRPPQVSDLHVEGENIPPVPSSGQEAVAQIVVSWNTDEPATSQVEFGEGSGTGYAQKTQEDSSLTVNHLVIISNLYPAKVYHLRARSKDKAGNVSTSVDTVTITPKATDNALNLVISNLQQAFGFLGSINQ